MNQVVILAGGKGSRMQSDIPKVLTPVKGIPIITRLLSAVQGIAEKPVVVVGYRGDEVKAYLGDACEYAYQAEQLGTGHALLCAKSVLVDRGYKNIIVMPGDHPLVSAETFRKLIASHEQYQAKMSLAIVSVPNYEGDYEAFAHFGRIVRDATGMVVRIVEYKDATDEERQIREVNPSYYCFDAEWLWQNIDRLNSENMAHEFYLTDMVALARQAGGLIPTIAVENPFEGLGVNDREQLEIIEKYAE